MCEHVITVANAIHADKIIPGAVAADRIAAKVITIGKTTAAPCPFCGGEI